MFAAGMESCGQQSLPLAGVISCRGLVESLIHGLFTLGKSTDWHISSTFSASDPGARSLAILGVQLT
jgi:hypothetical protein